MKSICVLASGMDFKEEMRRQGSSIPTQPFITGAIDEIHMSQVRVLIVYNVEIRN